MAALDQGRHSTSEFDKFGSEGAYVSSVDRALGGVPLRQDFFTQVKADYLVDVARRHFGRLEGLRTLDFGCGIGLYQTLLKDYFSRQVGVDVSQACLERARLENPAAEYQLIDGKVLPFATDSFDLIYTITVLHHVPVADWPQVTSEMHRVLRPGGMLLIFEHNPWNPLTKRVVSNCEFDADAVLLTGARSIELLRQAGFRRIDLRYILTVPAKGKALRTLDSAFSRIPIGAQYYTAAIKD